MVDNLFVEGIADQVLLAGMNIRLLRAGAAPSHCLDLNQVTIVAGGSHIPYMLYLARGRDQIKPACVVLVDGDDAGNTVTDRAVRREITNVGWSRVSCRLAKPLVGALIGTVLVPRCQGRTAQYDGLPVAPNQGLKQKPIS